MAAKERSASIFSQKLDRVAFTAYFLGAVAPLVALTVVAERYVFPEIKDRLAAVRRELKRDTEFNVKDYVRELEDMRDTAQEAKVFGAAVKARLVI